MDFNDRCTVAAETSDPHKRVLYTHGLLLGVGEFRAEQGYFLNKLRGHNRALHGYGTVSGLRVELREETPGEPELRVGAGLAIDPHGREICVESAQCARLNVWLSKRAEQGTLPPVTSPPTPVTGYVVLCYRECQTDGVPIPVGPCHSRDRSVVPSRVQDAFELSIADAPPAQVEHDAQRWLTELLQRVRIASEPGALTSADALLDELRAWLLGSPPEAALGSPPSDFVLDPLFAGEILRALLRCYVTEIRPLLVPEGGGCLRGPRDQTCVLLARVDLEHELIGDVPRAVTGTVRLDERQRPLLLAEGLMQALWLSALAPGFDLDQSPPVGPMPLVFRSFALSGIGRPLEPAPGPLRAPERAAPVERVLRLAAAAGTPLNGSAQREDLQESVAVLRMSRGGAAAFTFPPPEGRDASRPLRLRLHWLFQGTQRHPPELVFTVSLRAIRPEADFNAPPSEVMEVELRPAATIAQRGQLLVTEVELPFDFPPDTIVTSLVLKLDVPSTNDRRTPIFLVAAELAYHGRGG